METPDEEEDLFITRPHVHQSVSRATCDEHACATYCWMPSHHHLEQEIEWQPEECGIEERFEHGEGTVDYPIG